MAHVDGEGAAMRAAHEAGLPFVLSSMATTGLDDQGLAGSGPRWFQLSLKLNKEVLHALIRAAEAQGYSALVFTVDSNAWGNRERDKRTSFTLPSGLRFENFEKLKEIVPALAEVTTIQELFAAATIGGSNSWEVIDWVRSISNLKIVVKGVLRPEDAVAAARHGCAAIVVSNHGGRQLDDCVASIDALPHVVRELRESGLSTEVWLDGGIRRGGDIVKALAFGASAVLIGRPILWGLTVGGEAGVTRALDILRGEMLQVLQSCGLCRAQPMPFSPIFQEKWVSSKL